MASAALSPTAARPRGGVGGQADPYAPSAADRQRAAQMQRAWEAYHGLFRGGDPQWPLLWKTGKEPNPNIIINRCGPAADADVSWLFGESVTITLRKAPKAAQAYVDEVWGVSSDESSDDDKMALLQELATNGAVTGHAWLKIVWDEATMEYPQLVVLDSTQVRVLCDPHNVKLAVAYLIEYLVPDATNPNGGAATYRQVIELVDPDGNVTRDSSAAGDHDATWRISDYLKPANSTVFLPQGAPVVWPYNWAPIDGCPHMVQANQYYGRPRLTPDVIHVNEAICMTASNINKVSLRHGHPILYTVKMGANQRSFRYEPGTIMEVSSDIKAVEAHGDLQHLMLFEEDLRADFDEETHVPAQAFGRIHDIPRIPQSGIAIRLGYGPLLADITKERRTYGALLRRVTSHLLELRNVAWGSYVVTLGWQDPLPADDLQQAQVVQAADALGVISKATAAQKFGLDWDVEQQQMQEEQQEQLAAFAKGQGLPPQPALTTPVAPDPNAPPAPPQPGGDPAAQQPPQQQPPQHMPPVNHPAAIAARQAMSAAFGKTGGA